MARGREEGTISPGAAPFPRNALEAAVRERIAALREGTDAGGPACWCTRCEADVQALALSSLPAKYFTRLRPAGGEGGFDRDAVREAVSLAVRRVGARPRHAAGDAGAGAEAVAVVNHAFEVGFSLIDERVGRFSGTCDCWECRCDAVAFALNRFPSQYGVALGGRSAFPVESRRRMGDELTPFLDLGLRVVTALPRHAADPVA